MNSHISDEKQRSYKVTEIALLCLIDYTNFLLFFCPILFPSHMHYLQKPICPDCPLLFVYSHGWAPLERRGFKEPTYNWESFIITKKIKFLYQHKLTSITSLLHMKFLETYHNKGIYFTLTSKNNEDCRDGLEEGSFICPCLMPSYFYLVAQLLYKISNFFIAEKGGENM